MGAIPGCPRRSSEGEKAPQVGSLTAEALDTLGSLHGRDKEGSNVRECLFADASLQPKESESVVNALALAGLCKEQAEGEEKGTKSLGLGGSLKLSPRSQERARTKAEGEMGKLPETDDIIFEKICAKSQIRQKIALLGTGSYGKVWRCRQEDKLEVALKILKPNAAEKFQRQDLNHPNLVNILEVIDVGCTTAIVLDLCVGGQLAIVVHFRGGEQIKNMPLKSKLSPILDCARALAYLHDVKDIVHRDVKLSNVLMTERLPKEDVRRFPPCKIGDLGCARVIDACEMSQCVGTLGYMAPEVTISNKYGHPVDIFSLGMLSFELLTGKTPEKVSPSPNPIAMTMLICQGWRPPLDEYFTGEADAEKYRELISQSWCHEAKDRISAKALVSFLESLTR
eukprot:TRINITY_DN10139_c0_g8_i1.p1 TRINITY_DN10139_c0_g8~~TRINITY_DN10139_c0_g8_i1.p1  ORF type:complete len:397 (+),score=83.04 TRINITY_DN10139_c0_g8_i1:117-1307(+)